MEIEKRIIKYGDGLYIEIYHKKDNPHFYHRDDGPAYIRYNKDGSICYEEFWVNAKQLTKEDWEREFGWKSKLKGTPMGEIFLTSSND